MIREAIDRVLELARPETVEVGGLTYWNNGKLVVPPRPDQLFFSKLNGLVTFIDQRLEDIEDSKPYLHVVSPARVDLLSKSDPKFRDRITWATAILERRVGTSPSIFVPDKWYPIEEFIIKLQAQFTDTKDKATVLQLLGTITDEMVRTSTDDGVTQSVAAKQGVKLARKDVPNPVYLAPFRTFTDIDQPGSNFILRLKDGPHGKVVALFEADGGHWELEAVSRIAGYLEEHTSLVVVA